MKSNKHIKVNFNHLLETVYVSFYAFIYIYIFLPKHINEKFLKNARIILKYICIYRSYTTCSSYWNINTCILVVFGIFKQMITDNDYINMI